MTYTYDAWGNVSYTENPTGLGLAQQNPFVYHGYRYDWNTGLYYLNARYYNPSIGRFLSEDPVGPKTGDVLSYNEYAYTRNNPVNMVDPNGDIPLLVRWLLRIGGYADERIPFVGPLLQMIQEPTVVGSEDTFTSQEAEQLAAEGTGELVGEGSVLRNVEFSKGLRHALDKHLFGDGPVSLSTLDPQGNADKWTQYIVRLAQSGSGTVRNVSSGEIMQVISEMPKTGGGMLKVGVQLFKPNGSNIWELTTLLTKQ